ncbi:MAG: hypothetical protein KHX99_07185 [Atopobium sp.]|nr:hypothetical protein [Atopobium sp.]
MKVKRVPLQAQVSENLMNLIDERAEANSLTRSRYIALALAEFIAGGEKTYEGYQISMQNEMSEPTLIYDDHGEVEDVVYEGTERPWDLSGKPTMNDVVKAQARIRDNVGIAIQSVFEDESKRKCLQQDFISMVVDALDEVIADQSH